MILIPPELWQEVSEYLVTSDFLSLRLVSKAIADYIFPLYLIRPKKLTPLAFRVHYLDLSYTQLDLSKQSFPNLFELRANYAPNVREIPSSVRVLHCAGTSGISQDSLANLHTPLPRLLEICFQGNPKITDLSSQTNLEVIKAGPSLTQEGIKGLTKVQVLYVDDDLDILEGYSSRIYDVSFMDLRKLVIGKHSKIGQTSINHLRKLEELECSYHQDIFDVSMCPLKRLIAPGTRISKLPSTLIELDCECTRDLIDLSHLTKLTWLKAEYSAVAKLPPQDGTYSIKGSDSDPNPRWFR